MSDDRPRIRLYDVHIEGAADQAALREAIEQALAHAMPGVEPPRIVEVREAIRAEITREERR